ncbi:MAG: type II toxin-antitoxin system VapC family toxin [Ktedonobacteraceae bacterium]|nr:type II toxin-antitoxin system VapC family toxin [Ktedonobacteraceae bacterium]
MNNIVVVDTSVVVKWIVTVSDSDIARALLAEWTNKNVRMLAPTLLVYEAVNSLYKYIRAGQMPLEDAELGLRKVIFPLVTLDNSKEPSFSLRTIALASQFHLPATYDAHYLALAEREGCELWTADT